jgi:isoleucyl-tRNA synthetase
MVLALRRKVNINVRQPLAKMIIPVIDPKIEERFDRIKSLVLTEVNVKEVEYIKDTTGLITKKIKPNFRVLGKRYGKQMKEISSFFAQMSQQQIAEIEKAGVAAQNYSVELPSGVVELMPEDYEITSEDMPGWLVASEGKLTIALDITITEELKNEGIARELINSIQNLRKDSNFEVTDKINIEIVTKDEIAASVAKFGEYIASQTLAMNIKLVDSMEGGKEIEWLGDEVVTIKLERI